MQFVNGILLLAALLLSPTVLRAQDEGVQAETVIAARNPFAAPVNAPDSADGWQDVVFDGTAGAALPGIKVSGLMSFGDKSAVSAEVDGLGPIVFRQDERIVFGGAKQHWFVVRDISETTMTIELDDGSRIRGRFF